jgi:hypothetical protein
MSLLTSESEGLESWSRYRFLCRQNANRQELVAGLRRHEGPNSRISTVPWPGWAGAPPSTESINSSASSS